MSPTAEAQMVKLPKTLVARLDAARGDVARPVFLDSLLDEYERQDGHAQTAAASPAKRSRPRTVSDTDPAERPISSSSCTHPAVRRIGDGCAACGTTGLKVLGKR